MELNQIQGCCGVGVLSGLNAATAASVKKAIAGHCFSAIVATVVAEAPAKALEANGFKLVGKSYNTTNRNIGTYMLTATPASQSASNSTVFAAGR